MVAISREAKTVIIIIIIIIVVVVVIVVVIVVATVVVDSVAILVYMQSFPFTDSYNLITAKSNLK